jgi:hypothetical protein
MGLELREERDEIETLFWNFNYKSKSISLIKFCNF